MELTQKKANNPPSCNLTLNNSISCCDLHEFFNSGKKVANEKSIDNLSSIDDFYAVFSEPDTCGLGLIDNRRLIAYVIFNICGKNSNIQSIAVDSRYRRRGFGQQLLCQALDFSFNVGCRICILRVRVSNHVAIALYEKHNFSITKKMYGYYENPSEDAFEMICYL